MSYALMKEMIFVWNLYLIIFRAEYGEKTVQKLNLRIDTIISDLVVERSKTQNVNDQLDETFELFVNN
jgi:hypothetical protein